MKFIINSMPSIFLKYQLLNSIIYIINLNVEQQLQ